MTDLKLRQAAPCEYPFVCCCACADTESARSHVKKVMAEYDGANHFIETSMTDDSRGVKFVRIDGYKKP